MDAQQQRREFLKRVEAAAAAAFAGKDLIERKFSINGKGFALRFADEILAAAMTRALNHLAMDDATEILLTIHCWDVAGSGVACPLPEWPDQYFMGRGDIQGLDSPGFKVAYFKWINLLNVYAPSSGQAYYCIPDARTFPIQQQGSPALTIFSWWMNRFDWQFTHAAALGTEEGGVLVAGFGGAGKSTLAFSSIDTPLRYISDDYCVVVPGNPPRVIALYNSGKLTETSIGLLPHLRDKAANTGDPDREKAVFYLHEQFPGEQLAGAWIKSIVMPKLDISVTRLSPGRWQEAARIMGQSSLNQLAGSGARDAFRIMRLARELPVYCLEHGADPSASRQLLLQLCAS